MERDTFRTLHFHMLFDIGVITKGIDGALEIIGGALLFFVSTDQLRHVARILTRRA